VCCVLLRGRPFAVRFALRCASIRSLALRARRRVHVDLCEILLIYLVRYSKYRYKIRLHLCIVSIPALCTYIIAP
jgi:hypothetical protein